MEVKPGYKQTEVGVIPEEWEVKPLANCVLRNGRVQQRNHANTIRRQIFRSMNMRNVDRRMLRHVRKAEFITDRTVTPEESTSALVHGRRSVHTRNAVDLVGKVAMLAHDRPVACYNSNLMRLEFDSQRLTNRVCDYALNIADAVARPFAHLATGTTSVATRSNTET